MELEYATADLFADDCSITISDKCIDTIGNLLSQDLMNINRWCQLNKMVLNTSKTKTMYICSSSKHRSFTGQFPSICLNDTELIASSEEKLLGVSIVNTLNWDTHVNNILKKCNSYLYLLSRIKLFLSLDKRKLFFNAYILPHIDYCSTIWGKCSSGSEDKLLKFQKRAARIILDQEVDAPSSPLFLELNWMPFSERVSFQKAILMYKTFNNLAPQYLRNLLTLTTDISTRHLRSTFLNTLYVPKPSCELFRTSFSYSGSSIWNSLPPNIRTAPSLNLFKSLYLEWSRLNCS